MVCRLASAIKHRNERSNCVTVDFLVLTDCSLRLAHHAVQTNAFRYLCARTHIKSYPNKTSAYATNCKCVRARVIVCPRQDHQRKELSKIVETAACGIRDVVQQLPTGGPRRATNCAADQAES